ncbi:hypothetical protein WDU94_009255 [Cyamophila willieti]
MKWLQPFVLFVYVHHLHEEIPRHAPTPVYARFCRSDTIQNSKNMRRPVDNLRAVKCNGVVYRRQRKHGPVCESRKQPAHGKWSQATRFGSCVLEVWKATALSPLKPSADENQNHLYR